MDDEAAVIARRMAMAAAAWFNAPADVEAYRRLAAAVEEWNAYCAPANGPEAGEGAATRAVDIAPPNRCRHPADLAASTRASVRRELDP